ncbi:MAG: hypothetical protein ACPGED_06520, partial [Flavobacteriales bacterium]
MLEIVQTIKTVVLPSGIIVGTIVVASLFRTLYNKLIRTHTNDINNDPTNYKFLKHSISAIIYTI